MKKKTVSGTKEWASSNENIQFGCEHDCKYCYAKGMALRLRSSTTTIENWKQPTITEAKLKKGFRKRKGRIMFPTTHDITPKNVDACIKILKRMLSVGNEVLIVSKPHLECVCRLCEELGEYKNQILFRFTIGSADNDVLGFWEPEAPAFEERVESLAKAAEMGFQASVSCEPMLDDHIDSVVEVVKNYVSDAVWLGKANRLRQITSLTCPGNSDVRKRVDELILMQNDEAIRALYERYKDDPKVKWKESIKKVVGLERPTEPGLDI